MKKLILLSAATFFLAANIKAQTNGLAVEKDLAMLNQQQGDFANLKTLKDKARKMPKTKQVSFYTKQEFYRDFGDVADVKWETTANFDEAGFLWQGKYTTAYYDDNSKLVGTFTAKTFADLPESAQKIINKKYKDYAVAGVSFFDDNEHNETDMILYGVQFEDEDNYFVELQKSSEKIIVQVNARGEVLFFKTM